MLFFTQIRRSAAIFVQIRFRFWSEPDRKISLDGSRDILSRLGKRRLKNELVFLLQISRMAGCIVTASKLSSAEYVKAGVIFQ